MNTKRVMSDWGITRFAFWRSEFSVQRLTFGVQCLGFLRPVTLKAVVFWLDDLVISSDNAEIPRGCEILHSGNAKGYSGNAKGYSVNAKGYSGNTKGYSGNANRYLVDANDNSGNANRYLVNANDNSGNAKGSLGNVDDYCINTGGYLENAKGNLGNDKGNRGGVTSSWFLCKPV